jgi:hypothetical protein
MWALCACALLAAGCGITTGMANSPNTSPPTITSGPVTIATDHSTYAPNDTMHVTLVNHLSTAILAFDTRASCSIFSLEVQQNGSWQASPAASCPLGRVARLVSVPAGGTYTADISAGAKGLRTGSFANGQYRLVLSYYISKSGTPTPTSNVTTTIYSALLTVSGSGGSGSSTPPPSATGGTLPSK